MNYSGLVTTDKHVKVMRRSSYKRNEWKSILEQACPECMKIETASSNACWGEEGGKRNVHQNVLKETRKNVYLKMWETVYCSIDLNRSLKK